MRLLAVISKLTGVSTNVEASEVTLNAPANQCQKEYILPPLNKSQIYLKLQNECFLTISSNTKVPSNQKNKGLFSTTETIICTAIA